MLGGGILQNSQEGLLRSPPPPKQFLRHRSDLISQAFPGLWRLYLIDEASTGAIGGPSSYTTTTPTSERDMANKSLESTLMRACEKLFKSDSKMCFFVDGLDEHVGHLDDIICLIRALKALPNVEICVSSRPWVKFEQEFGRNPDVSYELHMQQWTYRKARNGRSQKTKERA